MLGLYSVKCRSSGEIDLLEESTVLLLLGELEGWDRRFASADTVLGSIRSILGFDQEVPKV
jgi:hypothetical protein